MSLSIQVKCFLLILVTMLAGESISLISTFLVLILKIQYTNQVQSVLSFRKQTMAGRDRSRIASAIFSSPPRGTALDKVNVDYDCILESLSVLEEKAESALAGIRLGIEEVREACNQRRSLLIRGEVQDESYGLTLIPDQGEFRWLWFTDGSSGKLPEGDTTRYGLGAYFGWQTEL